MCINCGCKVMDDDMGDKNNLTIEDLAKAAIASHMNGQDTLREIEESLKIIKPEEIDKKN